jgi:SAM-dependent methyltransferase
MSSELIIATVDKLVKGIGNFQSVVEIGSRDVNGSLRKIFEGKDYIGLDLYEGPGVDVVADATTWRPQAPVDVVVCVSVLEHAPAAEQLVMAAHDMLKNGGTLIIQAASSMRPHSAIDGHYLAPTDPPEWYRNISQIELDRWFKSFGLSRTWIYWREVWGIAIK